MGKSKTPPKWIYVYPQGTKEGDEEQKFFIALTRHPKYEWRSVSSIAKESKLSEKRIEELLQKYYKRGMVFQKNETYWGYWERIEEKWWNKDGTTITGKDQKKRITDAVNKKSQP